MERTMQTSIALVVAIAMMVGWLLTGCSINGNAKSIKLIVDGTTVDDTSNMRMVDDKLMVSDTFVEDVFGQKVEWVKRSQENPVYYGGEVAVLMYHDISLQPLKDGIISVDQFEEQMQLLNDAGFHVIGMDEYVSFMLEEGTVPDNAVLITFDDGYESFYNHAFPILKRFGYAATNFVIVSTIDDQTLPGEAKLTWEQMREMEQDGMSFYSHSYAQHQYAVVNEDGGKAPRMAKLLFNEKEQRKETEDEYRTRILNDLFKAEQRLNTELGNTKGVLAFPFGAYNENLLKIASEAGIAITFTTKEGFNTRLNRVGYRINGARAGEDANDLINKMKRLNDRDEQDTEGNMLYIDGQAAAGMKLLTANESHPNMIALRDLCLHNGWKIQWNQTKKQIVINRAS